MRGVVVCVVVLALLTAGCLQSSTPSTGEEDAPGVTGLDEAPEPSFLPFRPPLGPLPVGADGTPLPVGFSALRPGTSGAEPSIGVTSNGHVFITAGARAVRSADHGQTWTVVSTQLSAPTSLDPYLWVDQATDRVFHVNLYVANSYMSLSDDYGATWLTHPAAGGPGDHQKLTTGPPSPNNPAAGVAYASVVYYAVNLLTHTQISMSYDGGITWPSQPTEIPFTCASGGINGQPHGAPSGTAYVPYYDCGGLVVARSTDNGLTWTTMVVSTEAGRGVFDPDMASDRAGNTYAVWMGGAASNFTTVASVSRDDGLTWSAPVRIPPPELGTTIFPTVIAGDEGRLWIAYYATADTTEHPNNANTSVAWYLYGSYIEDAHTDAPKISTFLLDEHPVQVGRICTGGIGCDAARNLLEFIDIAADPVTGRMWVVYTDGCGENCQPGSQSGARASAVVRLDRGPSLLADLGWLDPLVDPEDPSG